MSKFLTVAGSKGGVGKTTVAINIATALSDFGRDIILVDASLETADIGLNLGAPMVKTTLHDVLNKDASISLHARQLIFTHPVSKEQLNIIADPPLDNLWDYFLANRK